LVAVHAHAPVSVGRDLASNVGVKARGTVRARRLGTLVHVLLAVVTDEAIEAFARVRERSVLAQTAVLARVASALIEVNLTVGAGVAVCARAGVVRNEVGALARVPAGARLALDILGASTAATQCIGRPFYHCVTCEAIAVVQAWSITDAGSELVAFVDLVLTRSDAHFAVLTAVSSDASTVVRVDVLFAGRVE
jgi:hypothetical protein